MTRVLVVDDERSLLETLEIVLRRSGHEVLTSDDEASALELFREKKPDIVLQDVRMGEIGGLELLKRFKSISPAVPVIVITAYSTWENAVTAMRLGAYDFVKKPFDNDQIRETVARAIAQRALWEASKDKRDASAAEILGNTDAILEIHDVLKRVAPTDSTVLIAGESGTGKELVARALHYLSLRASGPFVSVNCGAFPETLLESELFGHVKGSFSGAHQDKKGLLEVADKGTFFLDEIGETPHETQVKLLRVLEERRFYPVGGTSAHKVDVRFVAASNRDLYQAVAEGRFREDLYYRLNVIPITLPPLRERRKDIPLLAAHFLAKYSQKLGKEIKGIAPSAQEKLEGHDWPGNVRELENTIQRAVALSKSDIIEDVQVTPRSISQRPTALLSSSAVRAALGSETVRQAALDEARALSAPTEHVQLPAEGMDLDAKLAAIEKAYLVAALERTNGHLTNAARLLGITFRAIRYKIKKHGLRANED
ncbi:MAG TPA: sigma-54 dependent transcriptional regulator [Planctomycetota bacterium]|nr:sigma-54 dependent transcriptional regulator [Planctomycetota bacterium]